MVSVGVHQCLLFRAVDGWCARNCTGLFLGRAFGRDTARDATEPVRTLADTANVKIATGRDVVGAVFLSASCKYQQQPL